MRRKDNADRSKKIIVIVIAFLMFGSIFSIIFLGFSSGGSLTGTGTGTIEYNDLTFVLRNNFWTVIHENIPLSFVFPPNELEILLFDDKVTPLLRNAVEIDITSDFDDRFAEGIALSQYQMNLVLQPYNKFIRQGFTTEQENFPAILCSDATPKVPVVYFKSSNSTKVSLDGNCIIAEAATIQDTVRLKDRLVYGMLGIIN